MLRKTFMLSFQLRKTPPVLLLLNLAFLLNFNSMFSEAKMLLVHQQFIAVTITQRGLIKGHQNIILMNTSSGSSKDAPS